jgi:hypothetical protein
VSPIDDDELDRLADYTAGLLDPAEAARVRELIDTDPAWTRAYAGLTAAGPRLDSVLSQLGGAPIPEDVAERLSAALALQEPPRDTGTAKVVDLSTRRRWARPAVGVVAAAAVAAAIFGGIAQLSPTSGPSASKGTSANSEPFLSSGGAPGAAAAPGPATLTVRHSGTNYTAQTLRDADRTVPGPAPTAAGAQNSDRDLAPAAPEAGLSRLTDNGELLTCLAAVTRRYGGTPVSVDYANYQGAPALIVVLVVDGSRRIVVAGPNCGLPGTGADVRAAVTE